MKGKSERELGSLGLVVDRVEFTSIRSSRSLPGGPVGVRRDCACREASPAVI